MIKIPDTIDEKQREETILQFLPLVKYIVGRLEINLPTFVDREDLIETGIIGLIAAVDTYQPSREASLKTFVYCRVKGAIIDEIRKNSFFSREYHKKLKRLEETYNLLKENLGRAPSFDELREKMDITEEELGELFTSLRSKNIISINQKSSHDDGELINMLKSPNCFEPEQMAKKKEIKEKIAQAIERLPERERQIIVLYYYQGLLLKEISELFSISTTRVAQLHSRALYFLNQYLEQAFLRNELRL